MKNIAAVICAALAASTALAAPGHVHEKHDHAPGHDHASEKPHGHDHVHADEESAGHGHADGDGHDHGHDGKARQTGRAVTASAHAQRLIGLQTRRAERRRVETTLPLVGRFELSPSARFVSASPIAGRVSLKVRPLADVAVGDVLFTVASPELAASAREIAVLERRLAAYRAAGAKNAALESELAMKRETRAALLGGAAEETNGVLAVRALRAGRVDAVDLPDGAFADAGAAVLTLVDCAALRLKARVTPGELARLSDGLPVSVQGRAGRLRIGLADASGTESAAYVEFEKPNPAWRPGIRAVADCVTDASAKDAWCVPSEAVVQVGVEPVVFARDAHDAGRFIAIDVETGLHGGGWTEIRNFSRDWDVVVRGQYELRLALAAQTDGGRKAAGHFHADGAFHEGED